MKTHKRIEPKRVRVTRDNGNIIWGMLLFVENNKGVVEFTDSDNKVRIKSFNVDKINE